MNSVLGAIRAGIMGMAILSCSPETPPRAGVDLVQGKAAEGVNEQLNGKMSEIIRTLQGNKEIEGIPDTPNCILTLIGKAKKDILITISDGKNIIGTISSSQKSTGNFVTHIYNLSIKNGELLSGKNSCIYIENPDGNAGNCPEDQKELEKGIKQIKKPAPKRYHT